MLKKQAKVELSTPGLTASSSESHNSSVMKMLEKRSSAAANYHRHRPRVSKFALGLLAGWKRLELPLVDAGLIVAVSGGADSVALILAFKELADKGKFPLGITIAHLDHGLRAGKSRDDAIWVKEFAATLGLELVIGRASVGDSAAKEHDNLEQAARRVRYEFLAKVARSCSATLIATGHTMDDQAETVLLNLLRGSGVEGLTGIDPVRKIDCMSDLLLVRPFADWALRSDTERYCRDRAIAYRIDEMNAEKRFARVRVRKTLVPLMQTFNPKIVQALARTARLLRDDSATLEKEANKLLHEAKQQVEDKVTSESMAVRVDILSTAPPSLRRRALRLWIASGRGGLRRMELVHILAVEKLLEGDRGGRVVQLPGGVSVRRLRGLLHLLPKKAIDNGRKPV